jgi:hypothetical protein
LDRSADSLFLNWFGAAMLNVIAAPGQLNRYVSLLIAHERSLRTVSILADAETTQVRLVVGSETIEQSGFSFKLCSLLSRNYAALQSRGGLLLRRARITDGICF